MKLMSIMVLLIMSSDEETDQLLHTLAICSQIVSSVKQMCTARGLPALVSRSVWML